MSYCRWEDGNSDCYILMNIDGYYECMLCRLGPDADGYLTHWLKTAKEMLEHMQAHIAAGHRVPEYAIAEMTAEVEPDRVHDAGCAVSKVSKEANKLAAELLGMALDQVVPRLQQLIDARDEALTVVGQANADATAFKVRADVAEARIEMLEARARKLAEALEAHDTHVGMSRAARVEAIKSGRLEALEVQADARLAELVRQLRQWSPRYINEVEPPQWRAFDAMLAEYEP